MCSCLYRLFYIPLYAKLQECNFKYYNNTAILDKKV